MPWRRWRRLWRRRRIPRVRAGYTIARMNKPAATVPHDDRTFRRLVGLLQPWWGWIALATLFVVVAAPCELFPAVVWRFVTDVVVLRDTRRSGWMLRWFSLGGRLHAPAAVLLSSVSWLFVVYLLGQALETAESYILNRVAQRFILGFRNDVYAKLQGQSLAYLQRQRTGDLMARAMGDVDEIQSFIVNSDRHPVQRGRCCGWRPWSYVFCGQLEGGRRVARAAAGRVRAAAGVQQAGEADLRRRPRRTLGDVGNRLQENLSGVVVIKIFGREPEEAARFRAGHRRPLPPADARRSTPAARILPVHARGRVLQQRVHDWRRRAADAQGATAASRSATWSCSAATGGGCSARSRRWPG